MDHVGVVARREAAKLVVAKVREIAQGAPVFVTGDFNVDQNDEIYTIFTKSGLLKDSYEAARIRFAENGTFNAFKTNYFTTSRIDHVFVSPSTKVEAYGVLTNSYWTPDDDPDDNLKASDAPQQISFDTYIRHNPSDHYPVFVKVKL
jgi:endonuclease/exonuclease/phosphatase family metal-dependent hydrolase